MKKACVLLAEGFEEVEGLTPVDYLRRAGIEVLIVGVDSRDIGGGHAVRIDTDLTIDEIEGDYDAIIVPGGGLGSKNLAANAEVVKLITRHFAAGKLIAAICAAPAVVLHGACGILTGRRFTGYPGTEKDVQGATFVPERVVVDGNLITARGAGVAGEFSMAIIAALLDKATADELAKRVLLKG